MPTPSLDFLLLSKAMSEHLPDVDIQFDCYRDRGYRDGGALLGHIGSIIHQLWLMATSQACIVDGYCPAVSTVRKGKRPVVVQIWHALSSVKKFGWQSVGTPAGRKLNQAQDLCMHRNYDLVVAGGESSRPGLAAAFDMPVSSIVALGLPRLDYLFSDDERIQAMRQAAQQEVTKRYTAFVDQNLVKIVYAPTFRKIRGGPSPLPTVVETLVRAMPAEEFAVLVAWHPSDDSQGLPALSAVSARDVRTIDLVAFADYVVTDYSSIGLEAGLLGKKVLFYVPDIDDYRVSPGLNLDPEHEFPLISFRKPGALVDYIRKSPKDDDYAAAGLWAYCDGFRPQADGACSQRIARLVAGLIDTSEAMADAC